MMTNQPADPHPLALSRLQIEAWAAWNASYHAANPRIYCILGQELYARDRHHRITRLFARSDAQNALLDAALASRFAAAENNPTDENSRHAPCLKPAA